MTYTDEQIEALHGSASIKLRCKLAELREEADRLREEAHAHTRFANAIEASVRAGRWWELQGVLSAQELDCLAAVEPSDRTDLLQEG